MGTTTRTTVPLRWSRARGFEAWDGRVLRALAGRVGPAAVRFSLGTSSARASSEPPVATIRFRDRKTLWSVALDPVGRFGDAYAEGRIEVDGDLVAALESVYRALQAKPRASFLTRLGTYVPHTLLRDHR